MEYRDIQPQTGRETNSNPVNAKQGTCIVGKNWETVRPNVYRKVRGRASYGTGLPAFNISQFLSYRDRLIAHMSNNTLYYDSNGTGTFVQYSDIDAGTSFSAPESGKSMQGLEHAGNLYATTATGVQKIDAIAGSVRRAGVEQGLGFDLSLITGTIFATAKAVAYRVLWTLTDANSNKVIGAPSERQTLINASGGAKAVNLRIYLPEDITTAHFLEIYRSSITDIAVTPPEDFQLVYRAQPTSTEITAKAMSVDDVLAEGFRGAELYTNTTQEGISQSNHRPPKANSITEFKNHIFYGDIENKHRLYTALISVADLTPGTSTLTIANGTDTLTLGCVADVADATIASVADDGAGICELTTVAPHAYTSGDYVRFINVTGVDFPGVVNGKVYEVTVTAATTFTITQTWAATYTATGGALDFYEDIGATPRFVVSGTGTVSIDLDSTARSIIRTINQATGNSTWYAYYDSSYEDVVGKIQITNRDVGEPQFYVTSNSAATGSEFTPAIPTSGTEYKSTNDNLQHAVMWSKEGQGEAVPLINIKRLGSANDPVLRVVGLRDAMFIIKKKDGIYRMTGNSTDTWNFEEFDGTVECIQTNTITKGQNAIFLNSALGYAQISDIGVEVIGAPNEYSDKKARYNNDFDVDGYGWFDEEDKSYFVSTHNDTDSTDNDIVNVYNTFTGAWMQREFGEYTNDPNIRCARVINGLTYYAPLTGNGTLRERKTLTTSDLQSPDVANTITGIDTTLKTITLGTTCAVPAEAIVTQGNLTRTATIVNSSSELVLSSVNNLATNVSLTVAGAVNNGAAAIRITTTVAHGLVTGNSVTIASVVGTVEANGSWSIELVDATNFDLVNSAFTNAYVSGGTVTNAITITPGIVGTLRYQMIHCGMPDYEKTFDEAHIFFDDAETSVGNITLRTKTDADKTWIETPMNETDDSFGALPWGTIWGSNTIPDMWRTLIPEEHVRAARLYIELVHRRPHEQCAICGFSIFYNVTDSRYTV